VVRRPSNTGRQRSLEQGSFIKLVFKAIASNKMEQPEKNTETFTQTFIRAVITTTIIAGILFLLKVFPAGGRSSLAVFGTIWVVIFCIYFGGHWFELLFVNHIKFLLPKNIFILYFVRICYWFLYSIPLFALAGLAYDLLLHRTGHLGSWWVLGFIYISIQLLMYAIMQLRFKKSFYNGVY
jgi:hypothetical protein